MAILFSDISGRKQMETALEDSERRWDNAIAIAALGTFDWDIKTNEILRSDRSREMFGIPREESSNAAAGLKALQSGATFDLLITDVGLPGGMNGPQVADAGRALRPGLRVLFITGDAESAVFRSRQLEPNMQVMTKPFTVDSLTAKIRTMLEGR